MSEDKKTVVKMAYIYSQEGRWDKAIAEYKKLIRLDPEDFNAQNMLGDVHVKKGEPQPAYEAYMVASDAYNRLGQVEKAMVVYRKIAKLDSTQLNSDAKKKQAIFQKQVEGETAMEAGELDKAVESFKAVLQLDAERFDIYQRLGDLYLRKGLSDLAVKQYNEIADIYFKNKLYKKAAPVYKKIIEIDPANVEAHAAMGEIHARSGNESDAKREYLLIAEAMLAKGDLDTALAYSKKAVQLKSIEAYYYLGQVLLKQDKHEEAKAEFEKLLKFKLNHTGALVSMGRIQEAKGLADEALKFYQRALKVEKANLEALLGSAEIYAKKGDKSNAGQFYSDASASAAALGDAAKSQQYAAKAKEFNPAAPPAPPAAAAPPPPPPPAPEPEPEPAPVEAAAPAPQAAAPAPQHQLQPEPEPAAAAQEDGPDPAEERATLMNLAQNYVDEGSLDEAIELYQRILSTAPADAEAKEALTQVYGMLARKAAPAGPTPEELARQKAEEEAKKKEAEEAKKRAAEDAEMARQAAEAAARLETLRRQAVDEQKKLEEMRAAQEAARAQLEKEAMRQRVEEDSKRALADAAAHKKQDEDRQALSESEMRKRLETEIRGQLEEEMRRKIEDETRKKAEETLRLKMDEELRKAEAEARKRADEETSRRMDQERKKLEQEKAEVRRRMEEEMRKSIEAQERAKSEREALEKVEAIRKKEEQESKLKIQQEVLARVQTQQKEMQRFNQKAIDEIRRKVEAAKNSEASPLASNAPTGEGRGAVPAPATPDAGMDDMDDFMTEAVADIYTKQGLVKEAQRIYEKILTREPGNAAIRRKLDSLTNPAAAKAAPAAAPAAAAAPKDPDPAKAKKSKVSYL